MPIAREGQFLVTHEPGIGSCLGIESIHLAACVEEARTRPHQGVFGCPTLGFAERNLDCLHQLPGLRKIWFWDVTLRSVEGVYALEHLRFFGVHPKRPGIDFGRLPELETLIWTYNPRDTGIPTLRQVRRFHVWHYNPRSRSFDGLPLPQGIEEVELNWANPADLAGLPFLPSLRRLGIARCRNLASLAILPEIAPNLEWLHVSASGGVSSRMGVEILPRLPRLQHAFIQDRLLVDHGRPAA